MRDCKLIVTVRDDKVNFEGQDISVEELAQIAGFLQVFVGMEGHPSCCNGNARGTAPGRKT